ncbi:gliding motility-associated-like protein [Oceanihabitans sediminis]|uniref:IPT/TIG domain-containing protein n=2 Tax=Oceanihabitans sediminis TaxID=1812012 RepID=A0A368P335_9FLAO|nr:T9SS type B sorting domain-containing protein [Oceanihabitans sediminis]RBP30879.1 gliding motility-associated-like protein [Oceanihabitans sediminis]RCU56843.1 hypothetical protein DU428_10850 [Oceanihabitans sediminis]
MKHLILVPTFIFTLICFNNTFANTNADLNSKNKATTLCPAPVITSFSPAEGPVNTLVTITGSNFNTANTLQFNGVNANFTIINDTEIAAYIPNGLNTDATISIESTGGCTGTSATDFTLLSTECATADIYISEVYDAYSGSYAVIELYNPTNSPVVLDTEYTIDRYGDIGDPTPSHVYDIQGTIPPLDTFIVILGSGTDCPALTPDFNVATGINDNDELRLLKNGTLIDIVHSPNERGYSIIRNPNATIPQTTFNASDWSISSNEDCSDLDSHTADPIPDNTPTITHPTSQTICENASASFSASESSGTFSYQWKYLDASGNWVNITNNTNYSGAQTSTLTVTNAPANFNGNQYYCEITSPSCTLVSDAAQLTVTPTPPVDTIPNQTVCTNYTLPNLTSGNYYTATNAGGTPLFAGENITTSQTIYIYNEVGTAPDTCSNESSFTVTVNTTPPVDTLGNQSVCTSYTLVPLTNGNYFTATNGGGTPLFPGDVINTTQTIYIYNEAGTAPNTCSNESNFTITVGGNPPVDTLPNQTVCTSYTLPTLTNGNYYTATNAGGMPLFAGETITTSQTIYIYNEVGTAPDTCSNESSFTVTVNSTPPVDTLGNQTVCTSYTLEPLTNGNYFTATNGGGTPLFAGDLVNTTQTIYIYNETGTAPNTCSNESNFTVTVDGNPPVDTLPSQTTCTSFTLPNLTNGNYYTATNAGGTPLFAGETITTNQTIYIYNEVGTAPNNCSNETSFDITILPATDFSLDNSNITIVDNTLTVHMADTSINYTYFIDNGVAQSNPVFNNISIGNHMLFVQDENACVIKSIPFTIEGVEGIHIPLFFTPNGDTINDVWQITDSQNSIKEILIFDRYGKLLKQVSPSLKFWDGTYRGHLMESNDYWYLITLHSGKKYKGHFSLKR